MNGTKKEYLPIVVAVLILVLLVTGLIITIVYNPTYKGNIATNEGVEVSEKKVSDVLTCDAKDDIRKDANSVIVTYRHVENALIDRGKQVDVDEEEKDDEMNIYGDSVGITLSNITDKIELRVSNDFDDSKFTVKYDDTRKGIYDFNTINAAFNITYTVEIYSKVDGCGSSKVREFDVKIPKFNYVSSTFYCKGVTGKEFCEKLTFEDNMNKYLQEAMANCGLDNCITPDNYEVDLETGSFEATPNTEEHKEAKRKEEAKKRMPYIIAAVVVAIVIVIGVLVVIIRKRSVKNEETN